MNNHWKSFWDKHVDKVSDDPFIQVGRTLNSEPMSNEMFQRYAARIIELLELESDHLVLDLCCGNGLLSTEVATHCSQVIGVDFSEKLIEGIGAREAKNIVGIVSDAMEIKFQPQSFHHIVMAAALQHFTEAQTIQLFKNMFLWLKPGGTILITDITDSGRIWNFYNSPEREDLYFEHTMNNKAILGTWFNRVWLEKLARHSGFSNAQALEQPNDYWFSHYRFDLLCRK
ncbi:MAG: class I SAM-dependent methyltransferase [Saprospiraceae bacterium]|nr:class I SAM-dependent methyltransferase [Saprospiraceae bacterium]